MNRWNSFFGKFGVNPNPIQQIDAIVGIFMLFTGLALLVNLIDSRTELMAHQAKALVLTVEGLLALWAALTSRNDVLLFVNLLIGFTLILGIVSLS
jgi:hypothetical protein